MPDSDRCCAHRCSVPERAAAAEQCRSRPVGCPPGAGREQQITSRRTVAALELEALGKAPKQLPLTDSLPGEQHLDDRARHQSVVCPAPRWLRQATRGDQPALLVGVAEEPLAKGITDRKLFQDNEHRTVSLGT